MAYIKKRKCFVFADLEAQENWINAFRKQGYRFVAKHFPCTYLFEKVSDTIPVTRIDYREFKHKADYHDYLQLFKDTGWQHLTGSQSSGIHYFQQTDISSATKIYSNTDSYADLYKRYSEYASTWSFVMLIFFIVFLNSGTTYSLLNPQTAYLTPGLWEKTGQAFWSAFVFETPFALWRLIAPYIWLIISIWFSYEAIKNYQKYKQLITQK